MIRVKICGVTRPEDAVAAAEAGAWAIGLIFARESPRFVDAKQALAITDALPKTVLRVGVFQNQSMDVISRVEREVPLDLIQLHGHEKDEQCLAVGKVRCIKAVVLLDAPSVDRVAKFSSDFLLVDRPRGSADQPTAPWKLAAQLAAKREKTLLAGGLTPENVAEAVREVKPWGVDVAGGVERSPGVKDHDRIKAFIQAARSCP